MMREHAMRRRTVIVLIAVGLFVVLLIISFLARSRDVQIGMSESEAEDILGGPGLVLKFRTDEELESFAESLMMQADKGTTMKRWDHRHSSTHVLFDRDGRVAGVYYPRGVGRFFNIAFRSVGLD